LGKASINRQFNCVDGTRFITGQSPIPTGLTKVGLPGAEIGLSDKDPSVAEVLEQLGYATGQFGKNHLGDKDEFLRLAPLHRRRIVDL
jgi:arylsulfatase A-like enzyme